MLKDITLGQYFPGKTVVHRLDPRTKLVLVIVYIVALFLAKNFLSYGVVLVYLIAVIEISRIRLRVILNSLRPLLFVILLTAILNLFYSGGTPIVSFWIFKISKEGIVNAAFMHDGFNAIGSCVRKEYTYLIYNSAIRNPFYVNRAWFYPKRLDEAVMLRELQTSLEARAIEFSWDDSLVGYLVRKSYSVAYGARNLRRTIQKDVEDPIAERIIDSFVSPLHKVSVRAEDDKVVLTTDQAQLAN